MKSRRDIIPIERIEHRIFLLRGQKVMLSTHLAELYDVEPRALVQAVKRNIERFPEDFMFQLSATEFKDLKSQIVTSSWGGLRRAAPYAFTEQGVAMLSSVLRSHRAIRVNIEIMRAFVRLRQMLASNAELGCPDRCGCDGGPLQGRRHAANTRPRLRAKAVEMIENAAPLDPAPRALQAAELSSVIAAIGP